MKRQNRKVRIGLRHFMENSSESEALLDFASGAPLASLCRDIYSEETKKAVKVMRRLGVKRSRAKVREYISKCGEDWRSVRFIGGVRWVMWG